MQIVWGRKKVVRKGSRPGTGECSTNCPCNGSGGNTVEEDGRIEKHCKSSSSRKMEESKNIVNHLRRKSNSTSSGDSESSWSKLCFCSGREGNFARDSSCPTRAAKCSNKTGHFAVVCKTKAENKRPAQNNQKGNKGTATATNGKA